MKGTRSDRLTMV